MRLPRLPLSFAPCRFFYVSSLAGRGGVQIAPINPICTHRLVEEEMARTKPDAIDALGIARFA